jgi:epoxyqueuosine reductase
LASHEKYAQIIKNIAKDLGFSFCGISRAEFLETEASALENWLKNNFHGKMQYMENYFDVRLNPKLLVEDAKIVVSLMYNYYTETKQKNTDYKISKYAFGKDYHEVIKKKLRLFLQRLNNEIGEINGRSFVDSAPILERVWAKKSGLGWTGKHSLTINKQQGSFFFLAELVLDIDAAADAPLAKDYCGTCTACIDACPTGAIVGNSIIDAAKCISYLTIELKDEIIPQSFKNQMNNYIFGCDICQEVCPWNRFSIAHQETDFYPDNQLLNMNNTDWENITEEIFRELFRHSPIKRAKFNGLKRNINFIKNIIDEN